MEGFVLARIVHILAIIFWIGGVAIVTTVLIPAIRKDVNDYFQYVRRPVCAAGKVCGAAGGSLGLLHALLPGCMAALHRAEALVASRHDAGVGHLHAGPVCAGAAVSQAAFHKV